MMPRQGKLLSYLTFLSVKEVLERGEKSKGILSRRQHWDNSVPDTLGSRSGFDKDPHPTEQLAIKCNFRETVDILGEPAGKLSRSPQRSFPRRISLPRF